MAGSILINSNNRFDKISFPQKKFTILWGTNNISIFELGKWSNIRDLELTKFSNISFQFQSCECRGNSPKSDMTCSTSCDPFFIELTEINAINFLTECFWFEHNLFLFPDPNSEKQVRIRTNRSQHITISTKANTWIWYLCSFSQNSVQLKGWKLIDIDVGPCSLLSNSKIFFRRMNSNRTNTTFISAVEDFFLFCEMIIDGVGDTRTVDNCISIEDESIVVLKTIMTVQAI